MPRATFLTLRGTVYYLRIPLSKADQRIYGRKELWRSLKSKHYKEALERLSTAMYHFAQDKEAFMSMKSIADLEKHHIDWLLDQYGKRVFNECVNLAESEVRRRPLHNAVTSWVVS